MYTSPPSSRTQERGAAEGGQIRIALQAVWKVKIIAGVAVDGKGVEMEKYVEWKAKTIALHAHTRRKRSMDVKGNVKRININRVVRKIS